MNQLQPMQPGMGGDGVPTDQGPCQITMGQVRMHLGQRLGDGFFCQSGLPGGLALEGCIAQRPVGRLGLQARLVLKPQVVPCAGPQVMGRRGGQPHRHRQPFQVLLADQAKACALDERRTKAPFPERAAALRDRKSVV